MFKYILINISLVGKKKKSDSMKFKGKKKKEYEYSRMLVIHIFPIKTADKKTFIHAEKNTISSVMHRLLNNKKRCLPYD